MTGFFGGGIVEDDRTSGWANGSLPRVVGKLSRSRQGRRRYDEGLDGVVRRVCRVIEVIDRRCFVQHDQMYC
jgi:hypothetical protein